MTAVVVPGQRSGTVRIPSSKSVVHRLLICAFLGREKVSVSLRGISRDILATAECLRALGAEVTVGRDTITLTPAPVVKESVLLRCGESGSTLRFLLPVAGALGVKGKFLLEGRLSERPMRPFEDLLSSHGMEIRHEGAELFFSGRLSAGSYDLPGDISSQYFSGLLMALPLLSGQSRLSVTGPLESRGYIALTEDALQRSGVRFIRQEDASWEIPGGQRFALPSRLDAEGDWSNAAFFLCMGAFSAKGITVSGLNLSSTQGDRAILELLTRFGAEVQVCGEEGTVTVRRGDLRPLTVDASPIPDLMPVVSVLSCAADGCTLIRNASRLRMKESDRLHSTAQLINSLGGEAEEQEDELVIHGRGMLSGGNADSFHDHRIAMSAAVAAGICKQPVIVSDAGCVEKSYPDFWEDLERCSI